MQGDTSHYEGALLEDIKDQNKAILESLGALKGVPAKLDDLTDDIAELKSDMKVIKSVVKDQSNELNDHEKRITSLETVRA